MEIPAVNRLTIPLALPLLCLTFTAGIDDIHDLPFREAISPGYSQCCVNPPELRAFAPFASAEKQNVDGRGRLVPRYFF